MRPRNPNDNCGLVMRFDADNWLQLGAEYNKGGTQILCIEAVGGYANRFRYDFLSSKEDPKASCWNRLHYRAASRDVRSEYSLDGKRWIPAGSIYREMNFLVHGIFLDKDTLLTKHTLDGAKL